MDKTDWAVSIRVLNRMVNKIGLSSDIVFDPKTITQQLTQNYIHNGAPTEVFSKEIPIFKPESPDDATRKPKLGGELRLADVAMW